MSVYINTGYTPDYEDLSVTNSYVLNVTSNTVSKSWKKCRKNWWKSNSNRNLYLNIKKVQNKIHRWLE